MAVIKHTSIPGAWYIVVSQGAKGKQLYFPFEGTREEAAVKDREINAQIKGQRLTTWPTILEALPDYTQYYKTIAEPQVVEMMLSIMRRCLLPHFGKLQAHQIIPALITAYTVKRLGTPVQAIRRTKEGVKRVDLERTISHRTVQKELNQLSAMLKWMHKNGKAEKLVVIDKPPKAKTRPKRITLPLTLEEVNRLIEQIPAEKKTLVLLMTDCGLRQRESLYLKRADVDLAGWRIIVRGKGGKVVVYPIMTNRLHETLTASSSVKNDTEWLVINPKTQKPYDRIKTLLTLAAKRAGIVKHITHHTLRHSYSTILMESGISTEARQKLMRHSDLATTELYTHISPEWLEKQAGSFANTVNRGSLSRYSELTDGAGI